MSTAQEVPEPKTPVPEVPITPAQAREQLGWAMLEDERKDCER